MGKKLIQPKNLIYLIFVIILIGYLVFANDIFTAIIDGEHVLRRSDMTLEEWAASGTGHEVVNRFRYVSLVDAERGRVIFEGAAFCEMQPEQGFEREVFVVLSGEAGVFVSKATPVFHLGDYQYMDGKGYEIPDGSISYGTTFSMLRMPEGEYEVYFFVREGSDVSGLSSQAGTFLRYGLSFDLHFETVY